MTDETHNQAPLKEIFDELFSLLETLETQNVAILQFLNEEGIATQEKLAPYLDRAGNAASVKWRAHRARMQHLFSPIPAAVQEIKKESESRAEKKEEKDRRQARPSAAQRENGKLEKEGRPVETQSVGTPNPITGRVPASPDAPSDAGNKKPPESKTPNAAASTPDASQAAAAQPPNPSDSQPAQSHANQSGESAPRPESEKAASAAKPR